MNLTTSLLLLIFTDLASFLLAVRRKSLISWICLGCVESTTQALTAISKHSHYIKANNSINIDPKPISNTKCSQYQTLPIFSFIPTIFTQFKLQRVGQDSENNTYTQHLSHHYQAPNNRHSTQGSIIY